MKYGHSGFKERSQGLKEPVWLTACILSSVDIGDGHWAGAWASSVYLSQEELFEYTWGKCRKSLSSWGESAHIEWQLDISWNLRAGSQPKGWTWRRQQSVSLKSSGAPPELPRLQVAQWGWGFSMSCVLGLCPLSYPSSSQVQGREQVSSLMVGKHSRLAQSRHSKGSCVWDWHRGRELHLWVSMAFPNLPDVLRPSPGSQENKMSKVHIPLLLLWCS